MGHSRKLRQVDEGTRQWRVVINVYAPNNIDDHDGKHYALDAYWQRMRAIAHLHLLITKKLAGAPINSLTTLFVRDDPTNGDVARSRRRKMKLTCVVTPHCMDSLFWISKKIHLSENNVMLAVTQDGWMGPFNSCKLCGLSIREIVQVSMEDNRANYLTGGHINAALKGARSAHNPESIVKKVYEFNVLMRNATPQMVKLECFPEGPGSDCNLQWECIKCNSKKEADRQVLSFKEAAYNTYSYFIKVI